MKYITITSPDINNGLGCRATLWVSGCSHACKGCHNNMYWEYHIGKDFIPEKVAEEAGKILEKEYIQGITLSGGDPLAQSAEDLQLMTEFLQIIKEKYPEKDIWIYSGDTYEKAIENEYKKKVIELCDVMVDGEFKIEERDTSLAFRGSRNQRIIDLHTMKILQLDTANGQ